MFKKLLPIIFLVVIVFVFFWQVFFKGLVPIPADTIVGLYHPYRDFYAKDYPNGIPFKNFLITDPVRQQYPWKNNSINSFKEMELQTWNPYSFSGTPNIANFQSAVFYPLNIFLFFLPFVYSWSFFILLQPLLACLFLYLYLRNLRIDEASSFLGGAVFAFSGFSAMWLEWGTVLHTALWLPLILLSMDKMAEYFRHSKSRFIVFNFKLPKYILWSVVLIFAIISSFFAGHLQTFFYVAVFSAAYLFLRIWACKEKLKLFLLFFSSLFISLFIILPQLLPTLRFIFLSGRNNDQLAWQKEGWFLPFQHFVQFLVPDFFGNPTTLNYWGTWNYGELTGYAGIAALVLSIFAIIFVRRKLILFFGSFLILSLLLATENIISKIPFVLDFPFISTAQPTRLLFITGFCISVLAAFGLNYLIKEGSYKKIIIPILIAGVLFAFLFGFTFIGTSFGVDPANLAVSKRNIYYPGMIFVISSLLLLSFTLVNKKVKNIILVFLILVVLADLFRFSWKFNTFSNPEYLYPETKSISYIKENIGNYRIATADSRILPSNFSIMHKIPSVEGYDPLYIERYAQIISAINRNEPNIEPPYGFNRIIRIENFSSPLIDLLGIKYVLSLDEMNVKSFTKIFEEGETKIFENKEVLPRAFFVKEVKNVIDEKEAISLMFEKEFDPRITAIVEEKINGSKFEQGDILTIKHSGDEVIVETENKSEGFLVLADTFYPTWHAMINNHEVKIYRTDFNFRGIMVPAGKQTIIFRNKLL